MNICRRETSSTFRPLFIGTNGQFGITVAIVQDNGILTVRSGVKAKGVIYDLR